MRYTYNWKSKSQDITIVIDCANKKKANTVLKNLCESHYDLFKSVPEKKVTSVKVNNRQARLPYPFAAFGELIKLARGKDKKLADQACWELSKHFMP